LASGLRDRLRGFLESSEEVEDEAEEEEVYAEEYVVPDEAARIVLGSRGEPVEGVVGRLVGGGLSFVEASRVLYVLGRRGEVALRDPDPPRTLYGFFRSWYSGWFWAVVGFLAVVSSAVFLFPQTDPWIYVRYVAGAMYVLYVPGAVFIEALYPVRGELEDLERFALGVGLSLALVPLVGLVLNYTPWGIRLEPIFVSLTLLTVVLAVVAVYRKYVYHLLRLVAVEAA